jgi:transcriptional regulator GlxA family with amidase domain
VTPKRFARLHRFRSAVRMLAATPAPALARVAQVCGYFDQAHLNREFREFAGRTPGEVLASKGACAQVNFVQDATPRPS